MTTMILIYLVLMMRYEFVCPKKLYSSFDALQDEDKAAEELKQRRIAEYQEKKAHSEHNLVN